MTTSIANALTLMVIGMITVFVVLFLVYLTGRLLIQLVNRWTPEKPDSSDPVQHISNDKIAAITAAIEAVTQGQASITNIQKH
jgi:oxaloacetate decarboxylase gamma subunit